jgi:hypothetical protein
LDEGPRSASASTEEKETVDKRRANLNAPIPPTHPRTSKVLNLLPNDINPPLITRVQLETVVPHRDAVAAVDLARDGEDRTGFAGSWGTVEEEMRDAGFEDELVD